MNYFLDDKINKAEILFPGVACFLIAVCLGSAVHTSNAVDNRGKLSTLSKDYGTEQGYNSFPDNSTFQSCPGIRKFKKRFPSSCFLVYKFVWWN